MKRIALFVSLLSFTFSFSQKSQNYLQISYASICCGTPSVQPVISYVNLFQKKSKIKPLEIYQQTGLGREGEFNLYIGIDQLSKKQKTSFIKGLQSAILSQNSTRDQSRDGNVNFDENTLVTKADLANARNLTIYKK